MASRQAVLAMCIAVCSVAASSSAVAQDAAETAQILSGVSQPQAGGGRSLGSAIAQSLNAARDAIAMPAPAPRGTAGRGYPRLRQGVVVPQGGDPLEHTDAPAYRLGSGATIRVSGGLVDAPAGTCVGHCLVGRRR